MLSTSLLGEKALEAALLMPPIAAMPPITPAPIKRLRRVSSTSGANGEPEVEEADETLLPDPLPWLPKALRLVVFTGRTRVNEELLCLVWALLVARPLRFVGRALVAGVLLARFCGTALFSRDRSYPLREAKPKSAASIAQRYCDI